MVLDDKSLDQAFIVNYLCDERDESESVHTGRTPGHG